MATYRKAPTRKDVAQLAGVSETIVSYVLNNNRYVAKDKRERVLEAVRQLQYRPNNIARALKGKRTNHILFICDNISNEYFGRLVEEMDRISYEKGFLISLLRGRNDDQFVSQVISRVFDGIVISSTSFEERHVVEIINSGVPVVLLMNREYDSVGDRASKIYTGLQNGVRDCVTLLAGQGRKHIVYIDRVSQNHRYSTLDDWRYNGFITQMQECGFKVTKDNVVVGYESEEQLYEGFRLRLQNGLKVDGIVGRNDSLACTAMTAAMSVGLRVPEDVAVIGFDNSRLCSYISPRLSSVELNKPAIAAEILNAFEHMLAGQGPVEKRLQAQLIEREST
ncbi:LacI family DNA-binding transcriptional regulator [Pseudoflavonifractor phocaeensis]|uniref:LacI family DNA-binding transcriptional regulator n=1 Tax=Pseudoflavonifractor phocaeensis TaxID=1870988 RepID=UPI0019596260|nr:LacI family DNA-binding transcriptional regulator [Pseudoflavonifractor phocaeensis]MBM6887060.1 LacI family DNA-binding transcriptional regulator [Pseudoflavonifractor phocaeensis]